MALLHPVLGPLHGKTPPPEHVLDRLHALHRPFVLTWRPGDAELPGMWVLWERIGDPLWRDAGLARRDRYLSTSEGRAALSAGIWLAIEAQIEGLHWFGHWPDEGCFSDGWFHDIARGLREVGETAERARFQVAKQEQEARAVAREAKQNPAYQERLQQKFPELAAEIEARSIEEFATVCRGKTVYGYAKSLAAPPTTEAVHA